MKDETNIFGEAANLLQCGVNALFEQGDLPEFMVDLNDIEIVEQIRTYTDEDEEDLRNLGKSLRKRQIHPLWLRIMPEGHPKPYRLISGEGRCRAARFEGLPQLRAKAAELTDEEAEDLQYAENVQRKNLKQIEEAKKLQRDLDRLGSVEAVMEKHHISRSRLSKLTGLLRLPEQTKRLLTEGLSADVEAISNMKAIEKANPQAAQELVDDLKATRGKGKVREKIAAVKETVKPPKGKVATPRDRSFEAPGEVRVSPVVTNASPQTFADIAAWREHMAAHDPLPLLEKIYDYLTKGAKAELALNMLKPEERGSVSGYLESFFQNGQRAQRVSNTVAIETINGWVSGEFGATGAGAIRLAVFLWGACCKNFNLREILEGVVRYED